MVRPGAVLVILVSACSFTGAGSNATDGAPDDGAGASDAGNDGCVDQCSGTDLVLCDRPDPIACPLGCDADAVECTALVPSNNADGHSIDTSMVSAWIIDQNVDVNTNTGEVTGLGMGQRLPGVGVINGIGYEQVDGAAVFVVQSMAVGDDVVVRGIGSLPLIIRSARDVEIRGRIDVSAALVNCDLDEQRSCPGPGGGGGGDTGQAAGGCGFGGDGNQGVGLTGESGGGGGAARDVGAKGGDGNSSTGGDGGVPDDPDCVAESIVPLTGGSGGGRGGDEGNSHAGGGGGGGALQISSNTEIRIIGVAGTPAGILAGGAGGGGGGNSDGGGGGGSGGSILLEAPTIHLDSATLAANGGAGGGGNDGGDGSAGTFDAVPAQPGGGGGNGGDGGAGGTAVAPVVGGNNDDGGGGGGAGGRIRLNTNFLDGVGTPVRSPPETMGTVSAGSRGI